MNCLYNGMACINNYKILIMKTHKNQFKALFLILIAIILVSCSSEDSKNLSQHKFNGKYTGEYLNKVAFPIGGIGAGMLCLEGSGAWSHLSVKNRPDVYNEPLVFAAIHIKGIKNATKVLQGPVPKWKVFGPEGTGNGKRERSFGLPRFDNASFLARFPFGIIELEDDDIPMEVKITGWSPFIPGDEDNSSLPVGAMEYSFKNNSNIDQEAVFSWNSTQIIKENSNNEIIPSKNGFTLYQAGSEENPELESWFTVFVDDPDVSVDFCWFRGGWFDALTMTWKNIESGELISNDPKGKNPPGASLFVPVNLKPGEEKTIRLQFCWYTPETRITTGSQPSKPGPAFGIKPSKGTAPKQSDVTGFQGKQLINTFDPDGDYLTGTLSSPAFKIEKDFIHFLIGGGKHPGGTCINLIVNDNVILTATGTNNEQLLPYRWDVSKFKDQYAKIQVVDEITGGWGHINLDYIIQTNKKEWNQNFLIPSEDIIVINDFEKSDYGNWIKTLPMKIEDCCPGEDCEEKDPYYKPWYAQRFKSIEELARYWKLNYKELKEKSEIFKESFYDSSLPDEVIEAVAANLTILKSPTVLRQADGRLWAWEGCSDNSGCCSGSCTHVWNYAQAIPHLFPALERSLRETEFLVSQDTKGHQIFRSNLPISPATHTFHAASDGQLGGIMKMYRDWRISGNNNWLKSLYPAVKQSLDYCIAVWDPNHIGALIEPHHNTYDIEFWGPDGMCSSFYLGALTAIIEMGIELNEDVSLYKEILSNGVEFVEKELFDGEYYIQKIQWTGLIAADPTDIDPSASGYPGEAAKLLKEEGPKYQYGTGCLSDGILGMWIASVCGLEEVLDNEQVTSHLVSIHKYNLKKDLRDHVNPQRPTYASGNEAGLLLCSWPKGGALSLPFVYSNEVWTGIEYQVASHLMFKGEIEKGLDIVRACRERYNGKIRNPYNEYECGHWYARAMSSYGLLQALTGARYDAVSRILYIDSKLGKNFRSFLSTETGFGTVGLKNGKPFFDVKYGEVDIKKIIVGAQRDVPNINNK